MSSNLKVNSLVPATGTAIGIGTTGGTIDFRCPATFGGNVTIGGTLTYDEVINIDSIGIVTARSGLKVTGGQLDVGSNIKAGNAGVITATAFSGSGASLTNLPAQATIANNADNRVITGGSGVNLNGEANLTFDGTNLKIGNAGTDGVLRIRGAANSTQVSISDNTSATLRIKTATGALGQIFVESGQSLVLGTDNTERLRITSGGLLKVNSTDSGSYHTIRLNTTTNNAIKDVLHVHSSVDGATAAAGYGVRLNFSGEQSNGNEYTFGGIAGLFSSTGATYGDLAFYTNNNNTNTERLRINSSGDILTAQNGTPFSWPSNPGHVIYPNGEYRSTSTNGTHIRCNRMNGDGHVAQWYRGQTNMVGYITITSSGTGYGSGSSDERTKKNIEAWDENILDKFKSLTPSKFNFNWEDDSVSKHKGYIAQNEFEKFPEAYPKNNLTDCDNEYHMFVPTDMTVYLMKGLKEAAEKIEQLEQENIALRIRVTNLEDN